MMIFVHQPYGAESTAAAAIAALADFKNPYYNTDSAVVQCYLLPEVQKDKF